VEFFPFFGDCQAFDPPAPAAAFLFFIRLIKTTVAREKIGANTGIGFDAIDNLIEFNPITLEIVWEYSDLVQEGDVNEDGEVKGEERKFYSNLISGAQRLKNGNTLICEGHGGRILEVTPEKEIVWEYISPYDDGRTPQAVSPNAVYRAYRIPFSWVPNNPKCE